MFNLYLTKKSIYINLHKNNYLYMALITQTISEEIAGKLAAESKKKGITIQALIRNILSEYYEQKELSKQN